MGTDSKMISKVFFQLLPAQILLVAIGSINSIIDGVIASNFIGPVAMAVIGLYMPLIKISETINAVMLGGSQVLCGQFLGKNQIDRTCHVFSLDLLLTTILAGALTLLCLAAPHFVAVVLRGEPGTMDGLISYILGNAAGFFPLMIGAQMTAFLQMERQQKRTYIGIGFMMAVNAGLDILLVQVLGWGLFGLGLATTISCWVFCIILGAYYFKKEAIIRFRLSGIHWPDLGPILRIGIPGALVTFCLAIRGILINDVLIRWAGQDGLSALSALNTFGNLLFAITAGLAAATRLQSSIYIGEEDRTSLIMVMKTALKKGVPMVCGLSLIVIVLAVPMTMVFYHDPDSEVFFLTKWLFRIFPLSMPLSAICVIFVNFNQSLARMKIVNALSVTDGLIGITIGAVILGPMFGAIGIWIAHVVNGIFTTAIVIGYAWRMNGRMPRSVEDLMALPEDFGVPEDKRLDITIRSIEEVMQTSRSVISFCEKNGVDSRYRYFAGLCMEEMAGNIVEHGFSDGKSHSIDVRVVCKENELLLRIKDDCRPFNPKERLAMIDPEDLTHNIGLRMVEKISKTMFYSHVLGLNVLTITMDVD